MWDGNNADIFLRNRNKLCKQVERGQEELYCNNICLWPINKIRGVVCCFKCVLIQSNNSLSLNNTTNNINELTWADSITPDVVLDVVNSDGFGEALNGSLGGSIHTSARCPFDGRHHRCHVDDASRHSPLLPEG